MISGKRGPSCEGGVLLGEEESPLPNKLIEIIKCFSGLIARLGPKKPSFLLCVPV